MLLLTLNAAFAATLTVDASGGASYSTIQRAINASRSGDTIEVAAGTYAETINTNGKDLTIEGAGSGRTTIDGSSGDHIVEVSSGETVTLRGFLLTGGSHGVELRGSTLTAEDVNVNGVTGAAPGGGFMAADGATLTVDGCAIRGITLTNSRYGGAFFIEDSTATISDCTVSNNSAYQGGAAYIWDSTVTLTDVDFDGNDADWKGGALRVREQSRVTLQRVTVSGSRAADKGGGVSSEDSDMTWRNSSVTGNEAGSSGGGICFERSRSAGLDFRGTISGNQTDGAGGGLYVATADLDLRGELSDNTLSDPAANRGAGLYFAGDDLDLQDLEVSGHRAYEGAGVYAAASATGVITADAVTFSANEASGDGGGLWSGIALTVTGSAFDDNRAGRDGGAIFVSEADFDIDQSTFDDNYAAVDGGALEVYRAEANLRRTDFTSNRALGDGGAVHHMGVNQSGADFTIASCDLINNRAGDGGGVYSDASRAAVSRLNRYEGNTPNGASFASPNSLALRFDTYLNNQGDGVNVSSAGSGRVEGVAALGNGGHGVELSATSGYSVYNSVFIGNTESGLRIYASSSGVTVENIDALDNAVGVEVQSGSGTTITNAILAWNSVGIQATSASPSLSYSNRHGNGTNTSGSVEAGGGNINEDPEYTAWSDDGNPVNDIVYLSSTSPCRDAGDPSLVDTDGSRSDMGSFGGERANDDDSDGDGYHPSDGDCDEDDASVNPGASDAWYDGVDSNCDGLDDYDRDRDGYQEASSGTSEPDCDDRDADVHPGADDPEGDGVDSDCDGVDGVDEPSDDTGGDDTGSAGDDSGGVDTSDPDYWTDRDGDGVAPSQGDCDDDNVWVRPGVAEVCDDGLDNDCDSNTDGDDAECRGSAACACASGGAPARTGAALLFLVALVGLRRRS